MVKEPEMSADVLLSRLKKVKRSGIDQWMACCPAHEDNHPSLSVKDTGNGKVLINCLAGCDTRDVLGAVGMDWDDVMPERLISHREPPVRQRVYASDALKAIQLEARIVIACAFALDKNQKLSEKDLSRLKLAMERINTALEIAG